ncbi:hypothetical protein [Oricola sp.]|nr:hypothetical protein [Oricola sp.]MCI5076595.1 hypothetical protein [Oricola sp.]
MRIALRDARLRPANDLVDRNFHAHQSNMLQVADITYAPFFFWLVLDA